MDYAKTFAISAAGMAVERTRVEVASQNLANAHTVVGADGSGYQPLRVVARTAAAGGAVAGSFGAQVDQLDAGMLTSLPQVEVEPAAEGPRLVYEPGHPLADAKGYVAYPAVDPAAEMVGLMSAMRAYEANVAAMNTSKALALKTLEIGGNQ
jgi:flagellar basal-body rod protein FlgC